MARRFRRSPRQWPCTLRFHHFVTQISHCGNICKIRVTYALARCLVRSRSFFIVVSVTWAPEAVAQSASQPADKQPSIYDKIWKYADFYVDKNNRVVQRIAFTGRFQFDYADVDADQGETSEWNLRRLRLGPRITLFRTFTVHTEVELNPQEQDPTYVRLTDAYVAWAANAKMTLTVGKQSVPFTNEGATSSRELLTIDRSNLANNLWFPQEYAPGVSVSGRFSPWNYRAGIYSSGAMTREFGTFNGGVFTLGVLGYDFAEPAGMREATVTANYIYQTTDVDNTFTRRFAHIISGHIRLEDGRWGFRGDVTKGIGYLGQRNVWGIMAMPFLNLTDRLQAVGRYTFLHGDGINGLLLATYEVRVVPGRGDEYNEGYLGVNYYFYGHRLKLQSGVQFADMKDQANDGGAYHGTSWVTGLRVGW